MLHLITGIPGASKTLNTLKDVISDKTYASRPIYYNNIKLVMLDFDVVHSFSGWFYGVWMQSLETKERENYVKIMKHAHEDERFVEVSDVPHLEQRFGAWFDSNGPAELWLRWVRKLYPSAVRERLENFLTVNPGATVDDLKQFNLHFNHFKAVTKWFDLPHGSVIIIDECQHWFPPRSHSAKVPEHVSRFETHRHQGFDVYLVTQNSKLLDNNIRRLAGRHVHFRNMFGTKNVVRYESTENTDFDDYFGRKNADKKNIKRDERFYGLYHSADQHTHKVRIPRKIFALGILTLVVLALAIFIYFRFSSRIQDPLGHNSQLSSNTKPIVSQTSQQSDSLLASYRDQPTSQPAPKVSGNGQIYDISQLNSVSHPLANRCKKLAYAGNERIIQGRSFKTKYYVNCFTGRIENIKEPNDDEEEKDSEETKSEVVELISLKQLQLLGYDFKMVRGLPVLAYAGNAYLMNPL